MLSKLNVYSVIIGATALNVRKQFIFGIVAVLLISIGSDNRVNGRTIETKTHKQIMITDSVVQCRTACVQHFLLDTENQIDLLNCREHNNCAMCWDFCQLLFIEEPKVFKSICSSHFCVSFNPIQFKPHLII